MLWKHNFKISSRNILRHSAISFSVIVGFSLSISISLPILLLRLSQARYDNSHFIETDRIYRITTTSNGLQWAYSPPNVNEQLKQYPFVDRTISVQAQKLMVSIHGALPYSVDGLIIDQGFAEIFQVSTLEGMAALKNLAPFQIALTKETASLVFGNADAIGKEVFVKDIGLMTVVAVLPEANHKSHLSPKAYISFATIDAPALKEKWFIDQNSPAYHYTRYNYVVLSSPGYLSDLQKLVQKMAVSTDQGTLILGAQPIKEILHDKLYGDTMTVRTQPNLTIYGLLGTALFILATFNYISLSITRVVTRNQEIGVKRIFGASRLQIFGQLIVESLFLSLLSLLLGIVIMLVLPLTHFQTVINESDFSWELTLSIIFYGLVLGFVAGLIPAWLLSKTSALQSVRNNLYNKKVGKFTAQSSLLTVQFSATLVVLIILFAFIKQTEFMTFTQRDFKTKNIFTISLEGLNYEVLKNQSNALPAIRMTSGASDLFGSMPIPVTMNLDSAAVESFQYFVDRDFVKLFDLKMISGKDSNYTQLDNSSVIINQTAAKALSYDRPEDAIGQTIVTSDSATLRIVGVVQDFRYDNFKRPVNPLLIRNSSSRLKFFLVEFWEGENVAMTLAELSNRYKREAGANITAFEDFDLQLRDQFAYKKDISLLSTVSIYACCLALLTLFAMTIHTMNLRSREISIRKVYGASLYDLLLTLSRNYVVIFAISIMIALPIALLIVDRLLSQFSAKFNVGAGLYVFPTLAVFFLIAVIVVSQATIIALRNQVKNLRSE